MKNITLICLLFISISMSTHADESAAPSKPSDIPVEAFARLTDGDQMEMSPDATRIAYIIPYKGHKHIMVQKLDGSNRVLLPPIEEADIKWFTWKGNDILLISYRFTVKNMGRTTAYSRLMTYSINSNDLKLLIKPKRISPYSSESMGNNGDDIVDMLPGDPDHILLELDEDHDGDTIVFKVNVHKRTRSKFFSNKSSMTNWKVDEQKEVRWGTGYHRNERRVIYLNPVTDKWEQVQDRDWYEKDSIYPIKFFDDPRYAYVYAPNERGINGLAKFDMVEGKILEDIFSHDTVDISGLVTSPETGDIIGVGYTEHSPNIHFFDKGFEHLYSQINNAMGSGWSSIISMNLKKKSFLIKHYGSNHPANYYYLDGKTGNISFVMASNSDLPPDLMSTVQPVKITARDGLVIHGYLTLPKAKEAKNLPTIIYPHGGPGARDTMSFDVWAQFFTSRGYAVLQPNFRGSTGYGDHFKSLGKKQWGGAMQDDVTDATNWLIEQGIADKHNICIVGGSYGGYAALMGSVKEPDLYKCSISINGVANLPALIRHEKQFIGGKVWTKKIGLEGESIKSVSPYHQAERIKIPVLIIHAKDDPVVPINQGKNMAKKLKRLKKEVTYVEVDNGDHYLDTAEARLAAFKAMEKFLKEHLD